MSAPGRKATINIPLSITKKAPQTRGLFSTSLYQLQANGSCNVIVWSRSGPVETMASGQPDSSSRARR